MNEADIIAPIPISPTSLVIKARRFIVDFARHPGFYRDLIFFMASTATVSGSGFIYWKLVTLLYAPSVVGSAGVALSTAAFLSGIANLGLSTGIVRFTPQADPQRKAMLSTFSQLVSIVLALVFSIGFLLGRSIWAPDFLKVPFAAGYAMSFLALTIISASSNIQESVLQAERQSPAMFAKSLFLSLTRLIALLVLPVAGGVASLIGSTLYPLALLTILLFWIIPRYFRLANAHLRFDLPAIRGMFTYSLGNQVFNLLWSLPSFVFPLIIFNGLGSASNAYFGVAWLFVNLMLIIPNAISLTLLIDASHDEANLAKRIGSSLNTNLALLTPILVVLWIGAPYILGIFGTVYAANGVDVLRLFVLATVPGAVNSVYLTSKQVTKQIAILNRVTFVLVGLCVGLGAVLERSAGLVGIGWGWLTGQTVMACILIIPLRFGSFKLSNLINRLRR
ncbi:MAG: hypothetical protein ABI947_19020 [Chloroflexota bacterium]